MSCIFKAGGGLYPRMRPGAILLAAGEAKRMHGVNKLAVEILGGAADFGCRQFIERNPDRVTAFETDNDHYIVDIDSPEDIQTLEARLGLKFKLPAAAASVAA